MVLDQLKRTVMFLPWLRLKRCASFGFVNFLPVDLKSDFPPEAIGARAHLEIILDRYRDQSNKQVSRATLAVDMSLPEPWDLNSSSQRRVYDAAPFLYLAALAKNSYFTQTRDYVNSACFQLVRQNFVGSPNWMGYSVRRRDGGYGILGLQQSDVVFARPLQCHGIGDVDFDDRLLQCLSNQSELGSQSILRTRSALPFVQLANSDDDLMDTGAEVILMATAFVELLGVDGQDRLGAEVSTLLGDSSKQRLEDMSQERKGARCASEPKLLQTNELAVQVWIKELYRLRSKVAHGDDPGIHKWIWSPFEHLVLAAFAFPICVKSILKGYGYTHNVEDVATEAAFGELLCLPQFGVRNPVQEDSSAWSQVISSARFDAILRSPVSNE